MSVVRKFVILPALARLIRKERGSSKITEGYFAPQGGRTSLVRIDGSVCHLVLISPAANGGVAEERTEVPRAHGDALLDVCGGKAVYERSTLTLSPGRDMLLDRYVQPAGLDLISVTFDDEASSKAFRPPNWFGAEVSTEPAYERHAIAIDGPPELPRLGLNAVMLDNLLDALEPRFGLGRFGSATSTVPPAPKAVEDPAIRVPPTAVTQTPRPTGPVAAPAPSAPDDAQAASADAPASASSDAKPVPASERPAAASQPSPLKPVDDAPPPRAEAQPDRTPEAPANDPSKADDRSVPTGQSKGEPKNAPKGDPSGDPKSDARIDDVIESLSQALGAAIQAPAEPSRSDDLAATFERWQVRPRRTQQ